MWRSPAGFEPACAVLETAALAAKLWGRKSGEIGAEADVDLPRSSSSKPARISEVGSATHGHKILAVIFEVFFETAQLVDFAATGATIRIAFELEAAPFAVALPALALEIWHDSCSSF